MLCRRIAAPVRPFLLHLGIQHRHVQRRRQPLTGDGDSFCIPVKQIVLLLMSEVLISPFGSPTQGVLVLAAARSPGPAAIDDKSQRKDKAVLRG